MNFGKRATNKKRNALTSHSTMIGKKAHVSLLRIIFLSLLAIMVIGACAGLGAFKGEMCIRDRPCTTCLGCPEGKERLSSGHPDVKTW